MSSTERSESTNLEYQGKPLQAEKAYELRTFAAINSEQAQRQIPFQIMAEKQREQIDQDLTELGKKPDSTPISPTIQRVDYWIANGLWEEAIAEIYQAKNSSTELRQIQREITLQTCARQNQVPLLLRSRSQEFRRIDVVGTT